MVNGRRWGRFGGGVCAVVLIGTVGLAGEAKVRTRRSSVPPPVFAPGAYCDPSPWGQWCFYNPRPSGDWWFGVGGVGDDQLWIGGSSTGALHFDGKAWTRVDTGGLTNAGNFAAFSAQDAWVAGMNADGNGAIAHWDGTKFTGSFEQIGQFSDIWGSGPEDVYAVSYGGAVHWDGLAWSPVDGVTGQAVAGTGPDDVWVGESEGLQHFDGKAWQRVPDLEGQWVIGVAAIAPNDVWTAMMHQGVTLDHFDGKSWTVAYTLPNETDIYGLGAGGPNDVWAVGQTYTTVATGVLLHYDGKAWTEVADPPALLERMVRVGSANYAVGLGGQILQLDASAPVPFTNLTQGTTVTMRGVWGASPTSMWAVGDGGTVLRYDGKTIMSAVVGNGKALNAVWGTGVGDVWAVGAGGTVLHFDGTGVKPVAVGTTSDLYAVFTSAPGDVWIGGYDSTLLHLVGGVVTPVQPPRLPAGSRLLVLHGISKNELWLGGYNGSVGGLVTHWNGTSWSPVQFITGGPGGTRYPIGRLWEVAPDNVWVITERGIGATWEYLHFDGTTWTNSQMPPSSATWMFNGAEPGAATDSFAFDSDDVWSVGDLGAWRRRIP